MENKRKHDRLEQPMPVRHSVEHEDRIVNTQSKDISTGGLRIAADSKLEVGSKLNIEVNISSQSAPYYAMGEIVWFKENENASDKKFDIGIKFLRIVNKTELEGF